MSAQNLQQVQKQTQTLVLAPQLRQSLKILQAPAMDLRHAILEELQNNPAIEELAMPGVSLEARRDGSASADGREELDFKDNYKILQELDEDWREYFAQETGQNAYTSEDEERRQFFFDSLTSEVSLQEHLMGQVKLSEAPPEIVEAIELLVGSLDNRGYLASDVEEIARIGNLPASTVEKARRLLQVLDPPGLGSTGLRDCLLVQLELQGKGGTPAAAIVRDHLDLLLRRRIPEISRKLGLTAGQVEQAVSAIASLDPAPGRRFSEDTNRVIIPDVKAEKDNGNWLVTLNNDYIPRLRLSRVYKDIMAKGDVSGKEKQYLREKMRSGKFLISSIEQRQRTIERITWKILDMQKDFFEKGAAQLRPLTMSRVAEEMGVHETTVSRALANKYIETPHGVFPFKYFFTSGYKRAGGEAVANTSVKERIARIISAENPANPYSDQEIARQLGKENIKIARRTVAKYREELGILSTRMRRKH